VISHVAKSPQRNNLELQVSVRLIVGVASELASIVLME
jgi:hypothetical protein